ncbi:MAG: hypothetical protein WCI47_02565 [bacterium]
MAKAKCKRRNCEGDVDDCPYRCGNGKYRTAACSTCGGSGKTCSECGKYWK